jgi:nucleotide-binding universal stress UspA family protein
MTDIVLIGYDGSDSAKRAVVAAARLGASRAVVVTAVIDPAAPVVPTAAPALPSAGALATDPQAVADVRAVAARTAQEGADLANDTGLPAVAETVVVDAGRTIAAGLVAHAEQHGADLVVVGRRGVSRARAMLLGSVSESLVREDAIPVLIVPDAQPNTA